jgi:hypothetical protein
MQRSFFVSTGGQDAKTACVISLIQNIQQNTNIPYNRLILIHAAAFFVLLITNGTGLQSGSNRISRPPLVGSTPSKHSPQHSLRLPLSESAR